MASKTEKIPHFGLYGEDALTPEIGYVHIEDIETRSSETGWLIQPHRHGQLFQILCMYDGQVDVQVDTERYQLTNSWAITIPAGAVHGFQFSPGTSGVVLSIAEPLLKDQSNAQSNHFFEELFTTPQTIQLTNVGLHSNSVESFMALIDKELKHTNTAQAIMLEWLVHATLLSLHRQMESYNSSLTLEPTYSQLIAAFRKLVDKHYREHWSIAQYAKAMNISPTTLNRVCNVTTKKSAKVISQHRLTMEAKRRLIYTREHLDQIAYSLGFKDPGYFSRFFKTQEGISPSEYRRNRKQGQ